MPCFSPIRLFVLEKNVFRPFAKSIAAVGFKLFYYHARDEGRIHLWDYLRSQPDLRVIHIKRRNILKTFLSGKVALTTAKWTSITSQADATEPIFLAFDECLEAFIQTKRWEDQYDRFFANHPKIDVLYEDLASDSEREMERVQCFLGVQRKRLNSHTRKQATQPLHEAIANFRELKERFGGTEWAKYFEDSTTF